jgi:hypothetical protein
MGMIGVSPAETPQQPPGQLLPRQVHPAQPDVPPIRRGRPPQGRGGLHRPMQREVLRGEQGRRGEDAGDGSGCAGYRQLWAMSAAQRRVVQRCSSMSMKSIPLSPLPASEIRTQLLHGCSRLARQGCLALAFPYRIHAPVIRRLLHH